MEVQVRRVFKTNTTCILPSWITRRIEVEHLHHARLLRANLIVTHQSCQCPRRWQEYKTFDIISTEITSKNTYRAHNHMLTERQNVIFLSTLAIHGSNLVERAKSYSEVGFSSVA